MSASLAGLVVALIACAAQSPAAAREAPPAAAPAVAEGAPKPAAKPPAARPAVVFLEPVPAAEPAGEDPGGDDGGAEEEALPLLRRVADPARIATYTGWLDNPSARRALALYAAARRVAIERDPAAAERQPEAYLVALVPGGNHGAVGFRRLEDDGTEVERPRTAYIRLGPEEWRFGTTFLHETGHVVTALLAGGYKPEAAAMAAIPHSTAALTDRETAFQEGYAIHLETLQARLDDSPESRGRYFHERRLFGPLAEAPRRSEYYHHVADLMSFAQSVARYHEVAENNFAFGAAWKGPDYLRVQLEKSRDFAELRDADQLLQAEGFYAAVFYALMVRGDGTPAPEVLAARQARLLEVLADVLPAADGGPPEPNRPYLLDLADAYRARFPEVYPEILDLLLDLSHGVFVDPDARALWRSDYLAALRLDFDALDLDGIEARRARWREAALDDPGLLRNRLGPELPCEVASRTVQLVAFGPPVPLSFDLNTVQEGVLAMVPGLDGAARERWIAERDRHPFASAEDLVRRVAPGEEALAALGCVPAARGLYLPPLAPPSR